MRSSTPFVLLFLFINMGWSSYLSSQVLYPDSGWSLDQSRSLTQKELQSPRFYGTYDTYSHWVSPTNGTWCFGGKQGADVKTQVFMRPNQTEVSIHIGSEIALEKIYLKSVNCFYLNSADTLFIMGRSYSKSHSEIPISVRDADLTMKYSYHMFNSLMIYFGLMIGFIIVHMMLGYFSKFHPSYWYALFLGCYGLTSMMYANMESLIFESSSPFIQSDIPLLVTMTTWAVTGFTLSYFQMNNSTHLFKIVILILPTLSLIVNSISRFFPEIISYNMTLESFVFQILIIILLSIRTSFNDRVLSRSFIIGWGTFILGFVIFTLNEVFPQGNTMIAMYSTTIAHTLEMILFTTYFGYQIIRQQRAASESIIKSQQLADQILKRSAETLPGQLATIRQADPQWDSESKKTWEISAHRLELSLKLIRNVIGIDESQQKFTMKAWIHELSINFYHAYLAQRSGSKFKIISHLKEEPLDIPERLNLCTQIALDNAFKFSHNKEVILEMRQSDHNLVIAVHDDGSGFSNELLENYHTPFWQKSTGLNRNYQGLGLGFKVISELLSPVTAKWELGSSSLLKGALFSLYYPVVWKPHSQKPFERNLVYSSHTTEQMAPTKSKQKLFLLVDDNSVSLNLMESMVLQLGFHCHKAENGQAALTLYEENPNYFAILLDLQMPVMDGFETTKQIREFEQRLDLPATPIIAVTAHPSPKVLSTCQQIGIIDMIPKPIRLSQIKAIIELVQNQKHSSAHKLSQLKVETSDSFNLLVVDDNLINRKVICRQANQLGFETIQAENGQEAFDYLTRDYKFAAVLMDLQMPIVDGFEATKMIRLWEHTSGQPATSIIAVTAHSGPETLNQCLEYGMQDMISKPFQAERLISALQSQNIPMPQIQIRSSK